MSNLGVSPKNVRTVGASKTFFTDMRRGEDDGSFMGDNKEYLTIWSDFRNDIRKRVQ